MNNLKEIKSWPNDATVEGIQGKLKVYEYRTTSGGKTVQNAELSDASGERVRISVWEHPDLKPIDGKEVVLHSNKSGNGRFGGVSVKIGTYKDKPTFELSVSKLGTFQLVEVYKAQNQSGGANVPTTPSEPVKSQGNAVSGQTREEGQRQGMCFKLAGDYFLRMIDAGNQIGEDEFVAGTKGLCAKLVSASKELENGG